MRWLVLVTVHTVMDADWGTWIKYDGEDQSLHRFYVVVAGKTCTGSVLVSHQFSSPNYITSSSRTVAKVKITVYTVTRR